MKIIFLDIDGVLCTRRSHLAYGKEGGIWHEWDPLACHAINRACQKGVQIVISSTWRKFTDDLMPQLIKHDLMKYLRQPNWHTPIGSSATSRGMEISLYLEEDSNQDIEDYLILDDDIDMLEHQMKKFVQCDGEDGMTSDNIKRLLNWSRALKS